MTLKFVSPCSRRRHISTYATVGFTKIRCKLNFMAVGIEYVVKLCVYRVIEKDGRDLKPL